MFPFFPQWELHQAATTSQYNGQWLSNFNYQFSQDRRTRLIRSQGLVYLWGPEMFQNLIVSYSWQFFLLPVNAFSFCNLSGVSAALSIKD